MDDDERDPPAFATHPGLLEMSHELLRIVHPTLYGPRAELDRARYWIQHKLRINRDIIHLRDGIAHHLIMGDSRAAVVMETSPNLLVAAYSVDMDCVAMLAFHSDYAKLNKLSPGSPLITINTYKSKPRQPDLHEGPLATDMWHWFWPIIGDFLSYDEDRLLELKRGIPKDEWRRTWRLGKEYLKRHGRDYYRDGRPGASLEDASALREWIAANREG